MKHDFCNYSINKRCILVIFLFLSSGLYFSLRISGFPEKIQQLFSIHLANLPQIKKTGVQLSDQMESTPFVWNGKLKYLISDRKSNPKLKIINFETQTTDVVFGAGLGLASAIVVEKSSPTLYVFGTKDWGRKNNSVYMTTTSDLHNFSQPRKIFTVGKDKSVFNISVTQGISINQFIMAYEMDEAGDSGFSIGFKKTSDFINWEEAGKAFKPYRYNACPTIRWIDGYYYLWFLRRKGDSTGALKFNTVIARSKDLNKWNISKRVFLTPNQVEGINNSDVDLVYYNGTSYIFYATGDQKTYAGVTYATYTGKMEQLIQEYW